jgi:hypothetical protein
VKNFGDALGETLQDTSKNLLPFLQLMRQQRAESSEAQFERDLKLSKFQQDADQIEIQRQGLDERRHESRLAMYRYMNPRTTPQADPNSLEGLIARHIASGGKSTDPYVEQLTELAGRLSDSRRAELAGRLSDSRRADPTVIPSRTGAGMAVETMRDIDTGSRSFLTDRDKWNANPMQTAEYPGVPVDTLGMLGREYQYAKQAGEGLSFGNMVRTDPKLSPYMMRIENAVARTGFGDKPLAQFSDPKMSAVYEQQAQSAFRQQVPPDFDEWSPEEQQRAWELFMQGQ